MTIPLALRAGAAAVLTLSPPSAPPPDLTARVAKPGGALAARAPQAMPGLTGPAALSALPGATGGPAVTPTTGPGQTITDPAAALQANARVPLRAVGRDMGGTLAGIVFSRPSDRERAERCLAQAVFHEAGNEPLQGRRAVAQVVINRMRSGLYPSSLCGVVYQRSAATCQFTFACDGSLARPETGAAWQAAIDIARLALAGVREPSVGTAMHYHAGYVFPPWALQLRKIAVIGQHIFYRWPDGLAGRLALNRPYGGNEPAIDRRQLLLLARTRPGPASGVPPPAPANTGATNEPQPRTSPGEGGFLDPAAGWRPGSL